MYLKKLTIIFTAFCCALVILAGCAVPSASNSHSGSEHAKTGYSQKASTDSASNQSHKKLVKAKVIKVIDGDTIKVRLNEKEETVRFLLVDTPETHHPRLGVQPYGPEASQFTHKLLDGKTADLELAVGGGRDKYGRVLAYVYVDGKSVEEELLKRGLARVAYVYPPNTKYVDEYRAIQKKAQKKGIGIWSVEDYAGKDGYHPEVINNNKKGTDRFKNTEQDQSSSSHASSFSPDNNGNCDGQIKGNISGNGNRIYHEPGDQSYKVTKAEKCFTTKQAAEQDGFRAPRN
ncbi:thermonuclease family protein [Scopulibacillus cellulosilyticus]|uniref:Thermonuclease family protein n=1 Tax=Scopulibacillus cellulosilyticus TaxID=2665665 RepID=A0ABW2PQK9_9BACL